MSEHADDSTTPNDDETASGDRSPVMAGLGLAAIAALLLAVMISGRLFRKPELRPATGQRLVTIDLQVLTGDGQAISDEQLHGHVALINFWGPWCPPCIRELPLLVALHKKFAEHDDFHLLLVSCSPDWQPLRPPALGWREDVSALRTSTARLLKREKYDVTTYVDTRGRTRDALASIDGWNGYPTTILLDRTGTIREIWIGYNANAEHEMEDRIRLLLDEEASIQ